LFKAYFHDFPKLVEPGIDLFHPIDFQFIEDFPAFLPVDQEVAFGQDAQVLGNGLSSDVEMLCDGVGSHGMHGEQDKDSPSGGVGNCLKDIASHELKYEAVRLQIYAKPIGCAKFILL